MNTNFDPTIVFFLNGRGGGKIDLKRGNTTLKIWACIVIFKLFILKVNKVYILKHTSLTY